MHRFSTKKIIETLNQTNSEENFSVMVDNTLFKTICPLKMKTVDQSKILSRKEFHFLTFHILLCFLTHNIISDLKILMKIEEKR